MVSEEKLQEAAAPYLANKHSYWPDFLNKAPSANCRRYVLLSFYTSSIGHGDEEAYAEKKDLEQRFTLEDWKHVARYAGNNPFAAKCRQMIKQLGG